MRATRTTLGGLDCIAVQGDDRPPSLLVILCHGFGAPGDDLVSLAPELCRVEASLAQTARFLFPAAPLSLGFTGYGEGRAWWMIDMEQTLAAAAEGPPGLVRLRQRVPDGLAQSRRLLRQLIDVACQQTSLPLGKVFLGGFSQGAMLTTDVALRMEEAPAGLAILSGTLICEPEWRKLAPVRRGLNVVQSHGRADPILPYGNAEALRDLLVEGGVWVDFHAFNGPHTIPAEVLPPLAKLLAERAARR